MPQAQDPLRGIIMELHDCAFPLLRDVKAFDKPEEAFADADIAILVGARPRVKGMQRSDLLQANAAIFAEQGKALNCVAKRDVKVLVAGNPANTNAWIAQQHAPDLPAKNFTALMRLDHNRALAQIATKIHAKVGDIKNLCVWGNHSPTMYADYRFASLHNQPLVEMLDQEWNVHEFLPKVAERGTAILNARGASSVASAAAAIIDHMHDWCCGKEGEWVTMGVPSNGAYGIPAGTVFGFPVWCENGDYRIVEDLPMDDFSQSRIAITLHELLQEQESVLQG